jgi:hypothetical protein
MKKNVHYLVLIVFSLFTLISCNKEEIPDPFPTELVKGCYVINYGNFGSGGSSISKFDYETSEMINFYYKTQNGGSELLSNIQYAYSYNDSVYLIGNAADQAITVNPLFKQSRNGLTGELGNPRFCIADGDYLYISCWGANPDYAEMPDGYIAKYNLNSHIVEETIDLPGGPEGLAIAKGKLYAALNYNKKIAVINLSTSAISYIETPAVTSYFLKDAGENLYVTMISTWTHFSDETGLGYINTATDQLAATYPLENVSSSYGSMMKASADLSKIYVVTSAYDARWNLTGAVAEFNVANKSFGPEPFIQGISGLSGISVNPKNNNLYVFTAESTTGAGKMAVYSSSGSLMNDYNVGAFPIGAIFLE